MDLELVAPLLKQGPAALGIHCFEGKATGCFAGVQHEPVAIRSEPNAGEADRTKVDQAGHFNRGCFVRNRRQ
jgi:hypothetical protein